MRASLRLTIATPLSVGWYEPEELDTRHVKPASVKGVWRWWARAFVAGVLYERGCLKARREQGLLAVPDRASAERISEIVGRDLGMGYVGRRRSAASRLRLAVKVLREPRVEEAGQRGGGAVGLCGGARLQRLALLTINRSLKYAVGGEFLLEVEARGLDREAFQAAVDVLAAALTLGGLGKGSRKGMGSLDVRHVDGVEPEPPEKLVNRVRRALQRLVRDDCGGPPRELPPMPAISSHVVSGRPVAEMYRVTGRGFCDVLQIQNYFVRTQRGDALRQTLNAWALGLPRTQRGTGYFIKEAQADRRASTIMVSIHERHAFGGGPAGYLTAIMSADWPAKLEWRGAGSRPVQLDPQRIAEAYRQILGQGQAQGDLQNYAARRGLQMERIWP